MALLKKYRQNPYFHKNDRFSPKNANIGESTGFLDNNIWPSCSFYDVFQTLQEIFDFFFISWALKLQILAILVIFEILKGHKMKKIKKFQNSQVTFGKHRKWINIGVRNLVDSPI